ncbi:unnamed protein product [Phytophthora fragariaefolia]|uniref:Unnamed protein product n=1 Tax=Phytophthora fragariaefolia TaxID=1490495 RepID=A0A9W6TNW8_9STRA|nr:unnamed protein product [Phytophthora fragariaefolia]
MKLSERPSKRHKVNVIDLMREDIEAERQEKRKMWMEKKEEREAERKLRLQLAQMEQDRLDKMIKLAKLRKHGSKHRHGRSRRVSSIQRVIAILSAKKNQGATAPEVVSTTLQVIMTTTPKVIPTTTSLILTKVGPHGRRRHAKILADLIPSAPAVVAVC